MKKWTTMVFTLLLLEGIGSGVGDFLGKAVCTVMPSQNGSISSDRASTWAQHKADYEQGTDPSSMSVTG